MNTKTLGLLIASTLVLAACGNEKPGDNKSAPKQTKMAEEVKPRLEEPDTRSFPAAWVTRAKNTEIAGKPVATVIIRGQSHLVFSTGTMTSWANENMDKFATRAARYMKGMSDATGNAYCGQICSANGTPNGPLSIDIFTTKTPNSCAPLSVCSLPNGSKIPNYGKSTGQIMAVATKTETLLPLNETGDMTIDGLQFSVESTQYTVDDIAKSGSLYYVFSTPDTLIAYSPDSKKKRVVYDFKKETETRPKKK